jgi:pyruvate formate lyase activating enzyme
MARCEICGIRTGSVSEGLGVCLTCIRGRPDEAIARATEAHGASRRAFGLPECPPASPDGISCTICVNECRIPEGGLGYCGLRANRGRRLRGVTPREGKLSWYHDPLPTNCVGDWVCSGGTGAGYPAFAHRAGPEVGYRNLAVFFHACSFDCVYCQNWHYRRRTLHPGTTSIDELVSHVDDRTSCICYFGGDPTPQLAFSLRASEAALEKRSGEILRICWETNGSMHEKLLDRALDLSLRSGGCIKFDLKAWDENLHRVLTGVTNRRTLDNFRRAAEQARERSVPPLIIASTLLVPGYVEEEEVNRLAGFISSIDPDIPYSLLAFHPDFCVHDLPTTSRDTAEACSEVAREQGVRNVRIGNVHLLA